VIFTLEASSKSRNSAAKCWIPLHVASKNTGNLTMALEFKCNSFKHKLKATNNNLDSAF